MKTTPLPLMHCRVSHSTEHLTVSHVLRHYCNESHPKIEVASGFKKQGNDYYVGKRYKEARGFYTQALDAYPTDVSLKESLLTNRAACNLALGMFDATVLLFHTLTRVFQKTTAWLFETALKPWD